ncbi:MAG: hypothetical protein KKI08_21280 [Armatimonadetes bacterium]|nr:hypothetical protein [Armatimonadota bacterium]
MLERIKDVRGWSFLAQLGRLEQLHVAVCGTSDLQCASPSLDVGDLRITQCDAQCLKMLVQSTRARRVAIIEPAGVVFDCHQLAPHVDAASLTILAPLLRNLNVVCHKQRETLSVAHVEPDERLTAALSVCCQLRVLDLTATRPFGPALLPTLPGLERLVVPGYPEHRKAWVDFAVNNPRLSCFFASVPETGGGAAVVAVEEVHHGIDILRVNRRGRVQFAIEADVAGLLGLSCSNGDLEERLRSAARRARQTGLKWNSEADTLVVSAAAPASLRWVVDAARAAR